MPFPDPPRALLIMGVSGSGKSTVGAAVAQRLGWMFQDADALHPPANLAKMARGEALDDRDRAPWLAAAARIVDRWHAQAQHGVIACSALKRRYRQQLIGTRKDLHLVYLRGDRTLLSQRLQQRAGHFMPLDLLDSQLATLEAPMPEEAPIFNGQHCIHHQLRNLVIGDQLPLGTLFGIEQRSDHLRFELISGQITRSAADAVDLAGANMNDGRLLRMIGIRAGFDLDSAVEQAVAAHRRLACSLLGITGMAQFSRNFPGLDSFSDLDRMGDGVNPGRVAEDRTLEALVDHPAELDVVIGKHPSGRGSHDEENDQRSF